MTVATSQRVFERFQVTPIAGDRSFYRDER